VAQPQERIGFTDVDQFPLADLLVRTMDETAAWPAAVALRAHNDAGLALGPGGAVLDVGCGPGHAVISLAERVRPGGRAVGVDASSLMIGEARRRAAAAGVEVELGLGNARELAFEEATFDACRAERVLQWLDQPETALAEMVRVVRPGGRIGLIDTDWRTAVMDHPDVEATERIFGTLFASFPFPRAGRRLLGLCRAAGLVDLDVIAVPAVFTRWDPGEGALPGFLPFRVTLEGAVRLGVVDQAGAAAWLQELEAQARAGHFFASLTMFSVVGRKPV
jgi:ubiquinone/menaquinone biosynthesis C-methylase UbiE